MITKETTFSLTDLKRNTRKVINKAKESNLPLYIMDRSKPLGVFLNLEYYNNMAESLEDLIDIELIRNTPLDDLTPLEDFIKEQGLHLKKTK